MEPVRLIPHTVAAADTFANAGDALDQNHTLSVQTSLEQFASCTAHVLNESEQFCLATEQQSKTELGSSSLMGVAPVWWILRLGPVTSTGRSDYHFGSESLPDLFDLGITATQFTAVREDSTPLSQPPIHVHHGILSGFECDEGWTHTLAGTTGDSECLKPGEVAVGTVSEHTRMANGNDCSVQQFGDTEFGDTAVFFPRRPCRLIVMATLQDVRPLLSPPLRWYLQVALRVSPASELRAAGRKTLSVLRLTHWATGG
jgi:hypothetical protein